MRCSLVSAVALGEVGWHVRRAVSGDSAECEVQEGRARGGNVGCGSVNPRDPPSEGVGNSGGPGRVRLARNVLGGNKLGEGNGRKRKRLALLGANTRAHRAFLHRRAAIAAARRTGASNTYILETYPPVMHLRFAPSPQCPTPQLPLPRLVIIPTIMAIPTQAPPLPS